MSKTLRHIRRTNGPRNTRTRTKQLATRGDPSPTNTVEGVLSECFGQASKRTSLLEMKLSLAPESTNPVVQIPEIITGSWKCGCPATLFTGRSMSISGNADLNADNSAETGWVDTFGLQVRKGADVKLPDVTHVEEDDNDSFGTHAAFG